MRTAIDLGDLGHRVTLVFHVEGERANRVQAHEGYGMIQLDRADAERLRDELVEALTWRNAGHKLPEGERWTPDAYERERKAFRQAAEMIRAELREEFALHCMSIDEAADGGITQAIYGKAWADALDRMADEAHRNLKPA